MGRRAVFLDRDGTILEHYDYLTDPGQVQLLPTAATALRRLKEHGFVLVMVTNQSAVARGMLTEETLYEIHDRAKELLAEKGAYLDQIYYCPYHPEGAVPRYRRDSDLRKPAPGMLHLAAKEFQLDLEQCWMVGDDDRDIQAGRRAGCRTILLDSYSTSPMVHRGQAHPDHRAVNLQEAANLILHYSERPVPPPVAEPAEEPPAETAPESPTETIEAPPAETAAERPVDQTLAEPTPVEQTAPSVETAIAEATPEPATIDRHQDVSKGPAAEMEMEVNPANAPQMETLDSAPPDGPAAPPVPPGPDDEAEAAPPDSHGRLDRAVRDHEIERRKKWIARPPAAKPAEQVPFESEESDSSGLLLRQILRELKTLNRQQHFTEFSVFKLIAGVAQMMVIFFLVLALRYHIGAEPQAYNTQACLLVALILQVLTLTLLSIHKSS